MAGPGAGPAKLAPKWQARQPASVNKALPSIAALEIAVALATEPRILFLDEPTSGMGLEAMARFAELVQELKRTYTMIIIEHDMKFLFDLADRISVIHWGQVIAEGTPDELRANKWVQSSNLGKLV